MTYNKPNNVTYTDMCIWIDANAYIDDSDQDLLYQYLYHLVNMLAHEYSYFNKVTYYDEFSLFCASRLYMRLKSPKQFELDAQGIPKLTRIKSILNYIKTIIYPYKVDFEQEYYSHAADDVSTLADNNFDILDCFSESYNIFSNMEFVLSVGNISTTIKSFLKKIPRKKNDPEWHNIYLSCLLTMLNSITASKEQMEDIEEKDDISRLNRLYTLLRKKEPILYHLDASYTNYIKTLVAEIRQLITRDLVCELHTYTPSDIVMKNLIVDNMEEED